MEGWQNDGWPLTTLTKTDPGTRSQQPSLLPLLLPFKPWPPSLPMPTLVSRRPHLWLYMTALQWMPWPHLFEELDHQLACRRLRVRLVSPFSPHISRKERQPRFQILAC